MAFSSQEITNIFNSAHDYFFNRGDYFPQTLQARPFLNKMESGKKTFPGGKSDISLAVLGEYGDGSGNDVVKGYTHNDVVQFMTPANMKRVNYPWREHHIGLTFTHTEAKIDGISITDEFDGMSNHSQRELTVLVDLIQTKLESLAEQYARTMNQLLYGDGTSDPKALAGLQSIILDNPMVGTTGGLDRATTAWWRNRARTAAYGATGDTNHGGGAITSNVADGGALLQALSWEYRQLIRYGGKPNFAVCGSDFLDAMEKERRANAIYSTTGVDGSQDVSIGATKYLGTTFAYDPTLDDMGMSKRCYWLDTSKIFLMAMQGEWRKDHSPARPADQFIVYKSITSTGQLVASQLNSSIVMDIA